MGFFTKALIAVELPNNMWTREEVYFRTGDDDCESYHIGDTVRWRYSATRPMEGTLLDGVYEGTSYGGQYDDDLGWWVVIKDHQLHAVLPMAPEHKTDCSAAQAMLYVKYEIQPPPFDAWSQEAWAEAAKRQAAHEVQRLRWLAEEYGLTIEERAELRASRYTRAKLREEGLWWQILPPAKEETS